MIFLGLEMENEETPKRETLTFRMRENPWILSTFVLGLLVLILLVPFAGLTGKTISEKDAGEKLVKFASSQFPDMQITGVEKEGNLYKVDFISSKTGASSVYVTSDGSYLITGLIPFTPSSTSSNPNSGSSSNVVNVGDLDLTNAPMIGQENASVTVIEFSDLSCPYCAAADGGNQEVMDYLKQRSPDWQAPLPKIMKDYVNTGKAKIYFKYYPGHGSGVEAQKIGWCLNEQAGNKFWKYADLVFENQDKVTDEKALLGFVKQVGGDTIKINECLNAKKYDFLIDKDTQEGRAIGVSGTPAFYINGKEISGAQSYDAFKKIIDEELTGI